MERGRIDENKVRTCMPVCGRLHELIERMILVIDAGILSGRCEGGEEGFEESRVVCCSSIQYNACWRLSFGELGQLCLSAGSIWAVWRWPGSRSIWLRHRIFGKYIYQRGLPQIANIYRLYISSHIHACMMCKLY